MLQSVDSVLMVVCFSTFEYCTESSGLPYINISMHSLMCHNSCPSRIKCVNCAADDPLSLEVFQVDSLLNFQLTDRLEYLKYTVVYTWILMPNKNLTGQ